MVIHSETVSVSFYIYTGSHEPIKDASFFLYQDGQCIQQDLMSDDRGRVKIMDLESGTYDLKQETTRQGYEIYKETVSFTYEAGKPLVLNDIINHALCGNVMVQLLDNEKKPMARSNFTVTSEHFKRMYTSDDKGYCYMEQLPLGTYEIHQGAAATEFSITSGNHDRAYTLQINLTTHPGEEKKQDPSLWILSSFLFLCFVIGALYFYDREFLKHESR